MNYYSKDVFVSEAFFLCVCVTDQLLWSLVRMLFITNEKNMPIFVMNMNIIRTEHCIRLLFFIPGICAFLFWLYLSLLFARCDFFGGLFNKFLMPQSLIMCEGDFYA